ncbi:hypothetical protein M3Y99_00066100 [Aphelenchoides fujianensis]|nr:hypothetical protein M3Y99_00066100 [Aphelenchoides fujianensis]
MFLDVIEEESDEIRTQSSASSHHLGSNRAASAADEVDGRIHAILLATNDLAPSTASSGRIVELSTPSTDGKRDPLSDPKEEEQKGEETTASSPVSVVHVGVDTRPQIVFPSKEDGRLSNNSMSINLDRSRDSLLDHSVCSNPHDENAIIHQGTRAQQPTAP